MIDGRLSQAYIMLALIAVAILIRCLYWDDPHMVDNLFAIIDLGNGVPEYINKENENSSVSHGNDRNIPSSP